MNIIATLLIVLMTQAYAENIATGISGGQYYKRGAEFCNNKKDCNVIETKGSSENVELFNSGKADYILIQETHLKYLKKRYTIIAEQQEYVHIFYNRKKHPNINRLGDFQNFLTSTQQGAGDLIILDMLIPNAKIVNKNQDIKDMLVDGTIDYKIIIRSKQEDQIESFLVRGLDLFSFNLDDQKLFTNPLEMINYCDRLYRLPMIKSFLIKAKK